MARKKPIPRSQRKTIHRETQIKRDDTVKDISVSLMDMDSTIMYYFENVIKPTVIENGETIKVPIMYSSPERWFAIQKWFYEGFKTTSYFTCYCIQTDWNGKGYYYSC